MQGQSERIKKWMKKLDAATVGAKYDASKNIAVSKFSRAIATRIRVEAAVKQICDPAVPSMMQIYYINFANEIISKATKHAAQSLCNEVNILYEKHSTRGLNAAVLQNIINLLAPICAPVAVGFFRLDISLLDGTDVLA